MEIKVGDTVKAHDGTIGVVTKIRYGGFRNTEYAIITDQDGDVDSFYFSDLRVIHLIGPYHGKRPSR